MKKQSALLYSLIVAVSVSCVEPEKPVEEVSSATSNGLPPGPIVVQNSGTTPIAAKNYLQINNTFSKKTGISTSHPAVISEYNAILMQLPTTSDPTSLNGFNQIAQTRLAFAYCNEYVEEKWSDYSSLSNGIAIKLLLDNMVDVDVDNNSAHAELYANLMSIMSDEDNLLSGTASSNKEKLFKMSCAALLSSSYVSML